MSEILGPEGVVYRSYAPNSEVEYEQLLELFAPHLYPQLRLFRVKPKFVGVLGAGMPDFMAFDVGIGGEVIQWCLVEVELAEHPVLEHVSSQLQRFHAFAFDSHDQDELLRVLAPHVGHPDELAIRRAMTRQRPDIVVVIDRITTRLRRSLENLTFDVLVTEARPYRSDNGHRALVVDGYRGGALKGAMVSLASERAFCGLLRLRWLGDAPPHEAVELWIDDEQIKGRIVKSRPGVVEVHLNYDEVVNKSPRLLRSYGRYYRIEGTGLPTGFRLAAMS